MPMPAETRHERSNATTTAFLLAGVMAGPVASLATLEALYARVGASCTTVDDVELFAIGGGALAFVAVGLVLALLGARRERASSLVSDGEVLTRSAARTRFLAQCGVALCVLSAVLIIALLLPVFHLRPCDA